MCVCVCVCICVSHKYLKPIGPRHVANSKSNVVRFLWSCSDQENNLVRAVTSKGWLTNPLAEH